MDLAGQHGIRFREALLAGDAATAAALVPTLDLPHRVELVLGAALRDARDDFAAARLAVAEDWPAVCARLADGAADLRYDTLAAAYVASRRAPDRWTPTGLPLDRDVRSGLPDVAVAAALLDGVSGAALLDAFADLPLYPAVARYYRVGTLWALGCRPLLLLAATAGPAPG